MSPRLSAPEQTLYCSSQGYFINSPDNIKYAYWFYWNGNGFESLMIDLTNSELIILNKENLVNLSNLFVATDFITLIANTGLRFRLEKTDIENALFLQHSIIPIHPLRIKLYNSSSNEFSKPHHKRITPIEQILKKKGII